MESNTQVSPRSRLKQAGMIAACALVAVAFALTTPLLRTEPTKAAYKSETVLPASIRPHTAASINSKFPGRVAGVRVAPGDEVKVGDELVTLVNPDFQLEYESAKVHLQSVEEMLARKSLAGRPLEQSANAERTLAAATDRLSSFSTEGSEAAYNKSARNLKRLESLAQQQLATEAEVEAARAVADAELRNLRADKEHLSRLAEEVDAAKSRLDTTRRTQETPGDAISLEMELREARERLLVASQRCQSQKIVATIPGTVLRTLVNVGDEIPSGIPLLQVAQLDQLDFDVPVGIDVAQKIKVGQKVGVRIPTEPPTHIVAPVSAVVLVPSQDQSAYTVRITAPNPIPSARLIGLTGEVEFAHSRSLWHDLQF